MSLAIEAHVWNTCGPLAVWANKCLNMDQSGIVCHAENSANTLPLRGNKNRKAASKGAQGYVFLKAYIRLSNYAVSLLRECQDITCVHHYCSEYFPEFALRTLSTFFADTLCSYGLCTSP